MNEHEQLSKGVNYHQAGRLELARQAYAGILQANPRHADALHLLGLIAHQTGEHRRAIELIKKAIDIGPQCAAYYNNLGNALCSAGFKKDAETCFRQALRINPQYPEALFGLGNVYQELKHMAQAEACYRRALSVKPNFVPALNNLGVMLFEVDRLQEAAACYRQAIRLQPDYFEAHNNLGNTYKKQGLFHKAIDCYLKAIKIDGTCCETHASMGYAFKCLGQLDDAVACFRKAIQIKADYVEVYNDLGTAYRELGQPQQAMACYQTCMHLKPKDPKAYNNAGIVCRILGQLDEAAAYYQKALQLQPDFTEAHYNLGIVCSQCGYYEQAVACFRRTIQLQPEHAYALNLLVRQLQQQCAWQELQEPCARLQDLTRKSLAGNEKAAETPFLTFSLSDDPGYNFRVAKSWADDIAARMTARLESGKQRVSFSFGDRRKTRSKLTIGYLSADFRNHATAHLIRSLFACHDRRKFKIVAYSYGRNDHSDYRRRIEQDCDEFVDLEMTDDLSAACRIYQDEVDILVEMKGYTEGGRLEICALRPAPIQVSWLGFPGTTGADFLDYIITDRIVTPPDQAAYFSEKLVYMPHTYQINDGQQSISDANFQRSDFGLSEEGMVYCCFNEPYKIEPIMFDTWMRVLQQVPGSVLWLLRRCDVSQANLKCAAQRRGVAPDRLVFAEKMPKPEHLARLKIADLALDTRIVNGHTTASDALWAEVPVVTLQGKHFASRVAASVLAAAGLPELIARQLSEYESLAIQLGKDQKALSAVKAKLATNRKCQPLFDTALFTRNLEKGYRMMWSIFLNRDEPRSFEVM